MSFIYHDSLFFDAIFGSLQGKRLYGTHAFILLHLIFASCFIRELLAFTCSKAQVVLFSGHITM